MAAAPLPRLVVVIERASGVEAVASWQLPSDDALGVTPGVPGPADCVEWMRTWKPFEGPVGGDMLTVPLFFGADNVTATTTDRYLPFGWGQGSAPSNPLAYRMPRSGVLRSLRIRHNNPQGNGEPIVYTVALDGAPTALSVSIPSTDSDAENVIDDVPVAEGQLLSMIVTKANGVGSSPMEIAASLRLDAS